MIIKLREIASMDWELFLKWWKDDELIQLTSGIKETSDRVLLSYFKKLLRLSNDHHFIILFGKKAIGHIALSHKSKNISEIHIIIGEAKYRGKGLGTEAIKKAVQIAFDELGYNRIILEVRPDNKRAIHAYKKSGFVEGKLKKYSGTKQPTTLLMSLNK